jgi:NAD(P)H-dependent FMN reductase
MDKPMKLLAFAASNKRNSINQKLVSHAVTLLDNVEVELLDINDYEMPIYSEDRQQQSGIPAAAQAFFDKIGAADALLISFAEHNGSYTAAYKNLYDWASRIDMKVYQGKPMVMLATSPGPGGASNVLATAATSAPYFGGDLKAKLSIASFYEVFDADSGQIDQEQIRGQLIETLAHLNQ